MSHLLLLAVLLAGQVRPEQPTEPPPMAVQVGLFAYGPDGAIIGSATTGAEAGSFAGSVFTMPTCGFVSSSQVPDQATYAWVVKGEVLERRGVGVVVQIDWTRSRQDGRLTTLAGSRHVVIRKDVPLVLDEMIASQAERCEIARVSLEVRLTPRSTTRGGGRGTGKAGAAAPANASGGGAASVDDATPAFEVELWLVHGNPRMKERTVPMQVRMPSAGGAFAFPAITLTTPGGDVSATVGGRLAFRQTAGRQDSALLVFISRTLRLLAQPTPIREVANTGSTEIAHRMPGPDEVVAFTMPPIRFPDVGVELPDTLSVRLRVRPAR